MNVIKIVEQNLINNVNYYQERKEVDDIRSMTIRQIATE